MDKKLEQLFYVALGGALTMKDRLERNSDEVRKWQEDAENNARVFLEDLARRGEAEKDSCRQLLTSLVKEVIRDLDLVTREDLEQLKKDLDN
ncbi:MAG: hypothetical protein R6W66_05355 [Pelovirga sp.]